MIPASLTIGNLTFSTIIFFLFFAFWFFLFLFWRAAKHEFVDDEVIFDTLIICLLSALFFARVFEFATNPALYKWSFYNFFFLNPISGLSLWGTLFGAILAGIIYLRGKKYNFWQVFDLAAAPMALFLAIYNLGLLLTLEKIISNVGLFKNLPQSLFSTILFFVLFWSLKRLEKQKRHIGFFTSFFLVAFALLSLSSFYLGEIGVLLGLPSVAMIKAVSYHEVFSGLLLLFGGVSWYILAKRKVKDDIKGLLALFLLVLFRSKRILTSVSEADQIARAIVLLPFTLAKVIATFARIIAQEAISSFSDFAHALGFKK